MSYRFRGLAIRAALSSSGEGMTGCLCLAEGDGEVVEAARLSRSNINET